MLISNLLKFRDDLIEKISLLSVDQEITKSCYQLNSIISSNELVDKFIAHDKIEQAIAHINQLNTDYIKFRDNLLTVIDDIYQEIDLLYPNINQSPDIPYKKQFKVADNSIFNNFSVSTEISTTIKSRIHQVSDWHFPSLQLGCRNSSYTTELVSSDPLYLCDFDLKYVENVSAQFNDIYNKRLRKYVISNHRLDHLPQNQFGFIFSWMFFNFTDIDVIQLYLQEILKTLRPGGILLFSYNNGDMIESAKLFESGLMSFVPKRKLLLVCKNLGYEIVGSSDFVNEDKDISTISWVELKKPGELSTIKRSQAQGLIGRK